MDAFDPVDNKILLDNRALTNMHHISKHYDGQIKWFSPQGIPYLILPDPWVSNFMPQNWSKWKIARTITQEVNEESILQQDEMHIKDEHEFERIEAPQRAP